MVGEGVVGEGNDPCPPLRTGAKTRSPQSSESSASRDQQTRKEGSPLSKCLVLGDLRGAAHLAGQQMRS